MVLALFKRSILGFVFVLSLATCFDLVKSNQLGLHLVSAREPSVFKVDNGAQNYTACQALSVLRVAVLHGDVSAANKWRESAAFCSRSELKIYYLGQYYFLNGETEQAIREWSKHQDVAVYQLDYFLQNDNIELALHLMEDIRANYPDLTFNPVQQRTFFQAMGQLAMRQKDYETAIWAYEQGFNVDHTRIDYQVFVAIAERELGRHDQAKLRLEEALLLIPTSKPQVRSWAYEQLGLTLELLGEICEAQAAFRQALSLVDDIPGFSQSKLDWLISQIHEQNCDTKSP
jgi:tetratricopeptide (TPR) repeat protein